MSLRAAFFALALAIVLAGSAAAQVMGGAVGTQRGLFGSGGGVERATFGMTVDLDGGYDDISVPDQSGSDEIQALQSGGVASAAASLRFRRGSVSQFVLAEGTGSFSRQQIASTVEPFEMVQGSSNVEAGVRFGRRAGATARGGVSYEPTFVFGVFDTLTSNGEAMAIVAPPAPAAGASPVVLTRQRWLSRRAGAGAYVDLSSRQRLAFRYDGSWTEPLSGSGLSGSSQLSTMNHAWRPFPSTTFELSARHERIPQFSEMGVQDRVEETGGEARVRSVRRLSPRSSWSLMAGAGAVRVATRTGTSAGFASTAPIVSGTSRLSSRGWSIALEARRDVTVLRGLSPAPFRSDAMTLSVESNTRGRVLVSVSGGLMRGETLQGSTGTFDQRLVNSVLRYALGQRVGIFARYGYTHHDFQGVALASPTVPRRFSRSSARVGLTIWLPLYGSF